MPKRKASRQYEAFIQDFVEQGLRTAVIKRDRAEQRYQKAALEVIALEEAIAEAEKEKSTSEDAA